MTQDVSAALIRLRALPSILAVVTLSLLVAIALLALQVHHNSRMDQRRDQAVRVANSQALTLLSINETNVDDRVNKLLARSTGDFKRDLGGIKKSFSQIVRRGNVESTGQVDSAGIVDVHEENARVLLALSSVVTNSGTKHPESRVYRITVDLIWHSGRWMVAGMRFAP